MEINFEDLTARIRNYNLPPPGNVIVPTSSSGKQIDLEPQDLAAFSLETGGKSVEM